MIGQTEESDLFVRQLDRQLDPRIFDIMPCRERWEAPARSLCGFVFDMLAGDHTRRRAFMVGIWRHGKALVRFVRKAAAIIGSLGLVAASVAYFAVVATIMTRYETNRRPLALAIITACVLMTCH